MCSVHVSVDDKAMLLTDLRNEAISVIRAHAAYRCAMLLS